MIANDAFMTNYGAGTGIAPTTYATPPSVTRVLFPTSRTVERVIVWCGPAWQSSGTLITFDVQTTTDGTNWTTRRTITKPALSYFEFGTDSTPVGLLPGDVLGRAVDLRREAPHSCGLHGRAPERDGSLLRRRASGGYRVRVDLRAGDSVQGYRIEEIGIYGFVSSSGTASLRVGKGSAW